MRSPAPRYIGRQGDTEAIDGTYGRLGAISVGCDTAYAPTRLPLRTGRGCRTRMSALDPTTHEPAPKCRPQSLSHCCSDNRERIDHRGQHSRNLHSTGIRTVGICQRDTGTVEQRAGAVLSALVGLCAIGIEPTMQSRKRQIECKSQSRDTLSGETIRVTRCFRPSTQCANINSARLLQRCNPSSPRTGRSSNTH